MSYNNAGKWGNSGGKGNRGKAQQHFVKEDYKIRIDKQLETFKAQLRPSDYISDDEDEGDNHQKIESNVDRLSIDVYVPILKFPPDLNNTERKYVHKRAAEVGLVSKSYGKGDNRYLTVRRKNVGVYIYIYNIYIYMCVCTYAAFVYYLMACYLFIYTWLWFVVFIVNN